MRYGQFSQYWAEPIGHILFAVVVIILLYPLAWKLVNSQLREVVKAFNAAKDWPNSLAQLMDVTSSLKDVNRELLSLNDSVKLIDELSQNVETLNRKIEDLQKLNEEQLAVNIAEEDGGVDENERAKWEIVSDLWRDAKVYVESRIANITDGRRSRKYRSMTRYTYDEVADCLVLDGQITKEQADIIKWLDQTFRSIRNRKNPVTDELLMQFQAGYESLKGPGEE